jgi:acyl transferase domain-containing protein
VPQNVGYLYEVDGITSRDGHCRTFDAAASGAVRGSGLGIVVLRRLQEAVTDGDRVEAVIKGSAMNNDGGRKVGFTAPRMEEPDRVIQSALALAVAPEASLRRGARDGDRARRPHRGARAGGGAPGREARRTPCGSAR